MQTQYTVKDVARMLGITQQAVTKAIKKNRLEAQRFGRAWAINAYDIDRYRQSIKQGNNPTGKNKNGTTRNSLLGKLIGGK